MSKSPERGKAKVLGSFSLSFPYELRSGVAEINYTEAKCETPLFLQRSTYHYPYLQL